MGFPFDPVGAGLVYNVKSYGAFGDGVHDDTAAIQAAWNAAAAGTGGRRIRSTFCWRLHYQR